MGGEDLYESSIFRRYWEALDAINSLIRSTIEIGPILDLIVVEVARAIGADSAIIYVPEDGRWRAGHVYGLPLETVGRELADEEIQYFLMAAKERKYVLIDDAAKDRRVSRHFVEQHGIHAMLDIPLLATGNLVGDFSLHFHTPGKTFADHEVDFVTKAASATALALENATLFERHREAVQALREKQEKMEYALQAANVASWEFEVGTGKTSHSLRHHELFGYIEPVPEWTYQTFLDHVLPDDRERVDNKVRRIVETGQELFDEFRIRRADGKVGWMSARAKAKRDSTGRITHLSGIIHDISHYKEAEDRVLQSLDHIMVLVGVSANVLNETSIEGTLHRAVEGALVLTGAKIAASGHGFGEGSITVGARAEDAELPPCPDVDFVMDRGGVYLDVIKRTRTIRLGEEELFRHPSWWGLPEKHPPLKGLLGTRLEGLDGAANGMILLSHKRKGDFTEEDEALLNHLGLLTSLAIRHIDARTAAERWAAELEVLKKRLEVILQNTSAFIYLIDDRNRFLHVNRRYEEAIGMTSEQLQGRSIFEFFPHDEAAQLAANNRQVLREGKPAEFEEIIETSEGHRIYSSVKTPLLDNNDVAYAVIGISTDITYRKQAEEALRESEELFREVFAHAPIGMAVSDDEGAFIYVNDAYCKIIGYERSEILDQRFNFRQITHPDDLAANLELYQRLVDGVIPYFFLEKRNIRKDGSPIWVRLSATMRRSPDGKPFQVIALVEDINDRKRAMEELARSNRELEQFAYVASHDLKEPLRMISAYLKLLDQKYKGKLDEKADQYIHFAIDGAVRMQKLIEGLLAWARISTREVQFGEVATASSFEHAVANLETVIKDTGAVIAAEPLPPVSGDESLLTQLFQNLIGNAIKYRKPNVRPNVHISAKRQGDQFIFSITDNGIGIEPSQHNRIFEIFQRLHTREEYEGTGIGLASCKAIVERHHGKIWVQSKAGEGSTFYFTLPAILPSASSQTNA